MKPPEEEPPPILGTWRRLYAIVVLYLVATIVAFYVFERMFT